MLPTSVRSAFATCATSSEARRLGGGPGPGQDHTVSLTRFCTRTRILSVKPMASVTDPNTLQALAHPIRLRILAALREPASPAEAARGLGEPRQKVNYHVK